MTHQSPAMRRDAARLRATDRANRSDRAQADLCRERGGSVRELERLEGRDEGLIAAMRESATNGWAAA